MWQLVNSSTILQIGLGIIRAIKIAQASGVVFGIVELDDQFGPTHFIRRPLLSSRSLPLHNVLLYYKYALLALFHHSAGQARSGLANSATGEDRTSTEPEMDCLVAYE